MDRVSDLCGSVHGCRNLPVRQASCTSGPRTEGTLRQQWNEERCSRRWRYSTTARRRPGNTVSVSPTRSMRGGATHDQVIDPLPESHKQRPSNECCSDHRWDPADVGHATPSKPQHGNGQDDGADDHGGQPFFRHRFAMLQESSLEVGGSRICHARCASRDAKQECDKGQCADAKAPASLLMVFNRILCLHISSPRNETPQRCTYRLKE